MDGNPYSSPPPKRKPKRHTNLYIGDEAAGQLEKLKTINPERIIEKIRQAVEAEIAKEFRLVQKISGG